MRHTYEIVQPTDVERRFAVGEVALAGEALAARNGRLLKLRRALYRPKASSLATLRVPDISELMAGDLRRTGVVEARALHVAREAVWQLRALKAKGDESQVRRVGHDHMRACGIDEDTILSWCRDRFLLKSEHQGFYWQTQSFRAAFHDEARISWLPPTDENAAINDHAAMLLDSLTGFAREVVIAFRKAALAGEYTWVGSVRQGFAVLRALGHLEPREDTVKNQREDSHSFYQIVRRKTLFVDKGLYQTWLFLPQAHERKLRKRLEPSDARSFALDVAVDHAINETADAPDAPAARYLPAGAPAARDLRCRSVDFEEALGVIGVSRATLNILVHEHWIPGAWTAADGTIRFDGTRLHEWLLGREGWQDPERPAAKSNAAVAEEGIRARFYLHQSLEDLDELDKSASVALARRSLEAPGAGKVFGEAGRRHRALLREEPSGGQANRESHGILDPGARKR